MTADLMCLLNAIQWRWPGARPVTRGLTITRWDGPMPRPTDAEIAQAVADYAARGVEAQQRRNRDIEQCVIKALVMATFKALKELGYTKTAIQFKDSIRAEYDALG